MWDRIKQLWRKDVPKKPVWLSEDEQRALLEQASQALQEGQYAQAESQAKELAQSNVADVAENGMRLLGLVHFHQQQYAQAWPIFEKLAECTQAVGDWFNVVTSATLAGELVKGASAFEQALKIHNENLDSSGLSAAAMHLYYACALRDRGEYAKAFEHAEILRALYEKLPQYDARLLDLRGFPPLDAVLDMMTDVLAHSGDIPEAEDWLHEFGHNLNGPVEADIRHAVERLHRLAPRQEPAPQPEPHLGPITSRDLDALGPDLAAHGKEPRLD